MKLLACGSKILVKHARKDVTMNLRLREIRKAARLSQQDMADKLGIPKRTYGSWERGEVNISALQLCACADILDCSTDAILGREIKHEWSDPMERALHMTWEMLDPERKRRLLSNAQDMAAARGIGVISNANDGMTA